MSHLSEAARDAVLPGAAFGRPAGGLHLARPFTLDTIGETHGRI
ncbi:MAG: hypothetical protein AAGF90_03745 [Pseudomonadota bacterium]